jgi:hypothetical protein
MPPVQYREVEKVGVRYGILAHNEIEGAKIPAHILSIGLSPDEQEVGTYRVTKVSSSVWDGWAPGLFINPQQLEALENQE